MARIEPSDTQTVSRRGFLKYVLATGTLTTCVGLLVGHQANEMEIPAQDNILKNYTKMYLLQRVGRALGTTFDIVGLLMVVGATSGFIEEKDNR